MLLVKIRQRWGMRLLLLHRCFVVLVFQFDNVVTRGSSTIGLSVTTIGGVSDGHHVGLFSV